MIKLTASSRTYGNTSQCIAHITGRDSKFTFKREFTGRKDRDTTTAYIDEAGIYETCDIDKKGRKDVSYYYVYARTEATPALKATSDKDFGNVSITEADAIAIARRLDGDEEIADIVEIIPDGDVADPGYTYRLRTKGEAKRASAAATIDQAVDQCWQILQAFPEKEAKKIMAALKLRVSPKPAAPVADAEQIATAVTEAVE